MVNGSIRLLVQFLVSPALSGFDCTKEVPIPPLSRASLSCLSLSRVGHDAAAPAAEVGWLVMLLNNPD